MTGHLAHCRRLKPAFKIPLPCAMGIASRIAILVQICPYNLCMQSGIAPLKLVSRYDLKNFLALDRLENSFHAQCAQRRRLPPEVCRRLPRTTRAEGLFHLPPSVSGGSPGWLVLYDAPGVNGKEDKHMVFGDVQRYIGGSPANFNLTTK